MAFAPLVVVVLVNLLMSLVILPRLDLSFLAASRAGDRPPCPPVGGVWSVVVALAAAIVAVIVLNLRRLTALRASMDAGVNARCCRPWASPAWSASAPWSRRCRHSRW